MLQIEKICSNYSFRKKKILQFIIRCRQAQKKIKIIIETAIYCYYEWNECRIRNHIPYFVSLTFVHDMQNNGVYCDERGRTRASSTHLTKEEEEDEEKNIGHFEWLFVTKDGYQRKRCKTAVGMAIFCPKYSVEWTKTVVNHMRTWIESNKRIIFCIALRCVRVWILLNVPKIDVIIFSPIPNMGINAIVKITLLLVAAPHFVGPLFFFSVFLLILLLLFVVVSFFLFNSWYCVPLRNYVIFK